MYASVCLPVCMYLQYVYIYIRILNLYICASQPVLSVCLSYLSYLAYPYLPDSSFLCVLSVFYSYLYIICIYIYSIYYASFLTYCIYRIVISSTFTQFIYLLIDLRIYILFYQILFNPMYPIYPTMPCIYPVSIHLMRTVRLDRKSRPSSLISFFKHPTPAR